jgi:hypothetical protein
MDLPVQVFHRTAQWLHSKVLRHQVRRGHSRSRISIKLSVKPFLSCLRVRGGAWPRNRACLTPVNGEPSSENVFVLKDKRNNPSPWTLKFRVTLIALPPYAMDPNLRAQLNMSYAARYAPARYTRPVEARNNGHAPQTYSTQPQRGAVPTPSSQDRYTRPVEARNNGHAPQTYSTQPQRSAVPTPSSQDRYFDQRSAAHLLRHIQDPFVSLGSCQVAHYGQCAFAQ